MDSTETQETPETTGGQEAPETGAQEAAVEQKPTDWEAEAAKWKRLSRENEARAKSNAEKAKKFDEVEAANRTELEKVQARAEELEAKVREATRAAVAASHGVPAELVTGVTEEEMTASAETLKQWRGEHAVPVGSGVDAAGKRGEPLNTDQLTRKDMEGMSPAEIDKARKAGRFDHLMGINSK